MPNLTDVSVIKDLCARHGFSLSKGFGQNFISVSQVFVVACNL